MRRFLVLIITGLFLNGSRAQNTFQASLITGVNLTQIDGDQMGGFNKAGVRFGLQVSRSIKNDFTYYLELVYSQKGSRRIYNEDGPIGGIWDRARTDYMEVPLLLGWKRKKGLEWQAGLAGGFLARKSVYDYNFGYSPSEFFRRAELSFIGGIKYKISTRTSVSIRYQQSVLSVAKSGIPIWSTYTNFMIHKMLGFQVLYHLKN